MDKSNKRKGLVTSLSCSEPTAARERLLPDGCYYLRFIPKNPSDPNIPFYDGTMRVLHLDEERSPDAAGEIHAGGDLYCQYRSSAFPWQGGDSRAHSAALDIPTSEVIPIFPRRDYRYYLQILKVCEGNDGKNFTARFQAHEFNSESGWPDYGTCTLVMQQVDPAEVRKDQINAAPEQRPLFSGIVRNDETGEELGVASMRWISDKIRAATVIIDRVEGVEGPLAPERWKNFLDDLRWAIHLCRGTVRVKNGPAKKGEWSTAELHNAMLQAKSGRTTLDDSGTVEIDLSATIKPRAAEGDPFLDEQWCYHLFCVETIEGVERGVMYDTGASDSNNVPREGAAIACHWSFSADGPPPGFWGALSNKRLEDDQDLCFRVAVHEIGHAMGLDHNFKNCGFMCTTDVIAEKGLTLSPKEYAVQRDLEIARILARNDENKALAGAARELLDAANCSKPAKTTSRLRTRFANNVGYQFHTDDLYRLWFGPDITIRPGTSFEQGGPLFDDRDVVQDYSMRLELLPLLETVPLGAPVRVHLLLTNISDDPQIVPEIIGFSSGLVSGRVVNPARIERSFWPLKKCFDKEPNKSLAPGRTVAGSLTLLRGAQGPLFPIDGTHTLKVKLVWNKRDSRVYAEGERDVFISPAANDSHRSAALKILSSPDLLLSLALGSTHLEQGNEALNAAMQNDILRPHYAMVNFKAKAQVDFEAACRDLTDTAVLSFFEAMKIAQMIKEQAAATPAMVSAARLIQTKLQPFGSFFAFAPASCQALQDHLATVAEAALK